MTEPNVLAETHASSLAAFVLTVTTLRFFRQKGLLSQDEVNTIVGTSLGALEQGDVVAQPVAHAARILLSSIAAQLGVPLKRPN